MLRFLNHWVNNVDLRALHIAGAILTAWAVVVAAGTLASWLVYDQFKLVTFASSNLADVAGRKFRSKCIYRVCTVICALSLVLGLGALCAAQAIPTLPGYVAKTPYTYADDNGDLVTVVPDYIDNNGVFGVGYGGVGAPTRARPMAEVDTSDTGEVKSPWGGPADNEQAKPTDYSHWVVRRTKDGFEAYYVEDATYWPSSTELGSINFERYEYYQAYMEQVLAGKKPHIHFVYDEAN